MSARLVSDKKTAGASKLGRPSACRILTDIMTQHDFSCPVLYLRHVIACAVLMSTVNNGSHVALQASRHSRLRAAIAGDTG